jgi:hypothetical protein
MLSGHQPSRKSFASSLFSSIEPVDLNFDGGAGEQPRTVVGSANSEVPVPGNIGKAVNVGNSDVMAGGSFTSPKALFKVDLPQLRKLESVSKEDQRTHEAKQISLVAPSKTSVDKKIAGEVVLEDHAGGDMMEASYLLRSLCPFDIWIHFILDWPGARDLQLHIHRYCFCTARSQSRKRKLEWACSSLSTNTTSMATAREPGIRKESD